MTHTETHSPLPFVHSGIRHKLGGVDCLVIKTGPQEAANIFIPCEKDHAGAFRDAALITRSVNVLPSLVEALETLERNMRIIQARNDTPPHIASVLKQQEEIARAALALAKGE